MNKIDHRAQFEKALKKREEIGGASFEIGDLLKMPHFFEWVDCKIDGLDKFKMYIGGADDGVALRFFWNQKYENTTILIWSELAKYASIIIDIGAHTGAYTLAAKASNNNSTVLSFEPFFMNYSRLLLNLRGNNFDTSHAYMFAVSEKNGLMPFTVTTNLSYLSQGGKLGSNGQGYTSNVQVISLDESLPSDFSQKISLIKMDTEGHEEQVIKGMSSVISASRPIIFLESLLNSESNFISDYLTSENYHFFVSNDKDRTLVNVKNISPIFINNIIHRDTLNRIVIPVEKIEFIEECTRILNIPFIKN